MLHIDKLWRTMSGRVLDIAVRLRPSRRWLLSMAERQLFETYVMKNEDHLPRTIQQMRCRALQNLLHSVDRALADGRISPQVRRAIVESFIGKLVTGEGQRTSPFRARYGCDPPTFLTVSPTKRCNLSCKGCYAASSAKNDNTLPYGTLMRIISDQRAEWGSHFTVISGGEPLMYRSEGKDLFDVLRENPDQYFMMYTNATLIDGSVARTLAELGNLTPAISVEGWEKETDERRGKGVFRKIQLAIENLREAGVPFGVSVTATRENAETILSDEFMDYYFGDRGAVYGWIFQYMPIGRHFSVDLMVTPQQRKWMLEKELHMIENKNLFLVDFWNGGPLSLGCIAAGRPGGYFYIDWNGNVAPCVFFPYSIANIMDMYDRGESLSSVLGSRYFASIRSWQDEYLQKGGRTRNLFQPCPMRDHHRFARQTIDQFQARPMDEDAARALADPDYQAKMVRYDEHVAELLDPMWEACIYSAERK